MKRATTYANAPYGLCDADFVALVSEIQGWDMRKDTRANAVLLALAALTRAWPASHFPKRDREKWTHKAKAAFRVSESELAEASGLGIKSTRTTLARMIEGGFIVELAPLTRRGEGRGSKPPTYCLKCHVTDSATTNTGSDGLNSGERADEGRTAQTWRL